MPRRGTLWEGGARLLTWRAIGWLSGKTHCGDVRIGAEKRANTNILRQLGALAPMQKAHRLSVKSAPKAKAKRLKPKDQKRKSQGSALDPPGSQLPGPAIIWGNEKKLGHSRLFFANLNNQLINLLKQRLAYIIQSIQFLNALLPMHVGSLVTGR